MAQEIYQHFNTRVASDYCAILKKKDNFMKIKLLDEKKEKEAIMKKKYYAITASMTFEKTVLVPIESVKDIDEAKDLVDNSVEVSTISLLNEQAEFDTKQSPYADKNGIYELSDNEAVSYQIVNGSQIY